VLISLHLPKNAGASFLKSLEDHFGERLLRDYADLPLNTPALMRKSRAPYLQKKVNEESWSFERFCMSDEMRNARSAFQPRAAMFDTDDCMIQGGSDVAR